MAAPGHTLLLIPNTIRRAGTLGIFCESSSLPFICRKSTPSRIRVTRAAQILYFAAFPGEQIDTVSERVRQVFPQIEPTPSLLDTVFPYTNAIHHPPALLLNVGRVESTGGDYHHYYDGITPSVGRLIDALDRERVAVAAGLGVKIEPLPQFFFRMGYTNAAGRDGGTAYDVFHNSEPNRWIKAPASIDHRFLNEDVPYGLVAIAELGRLAGVATPCADAVIAIASIVAGRSYRDEGLTRERMGIGGMSVTEVLALLQTGRKGET
jgi:opine dehydrogenase